MALVVDAQSKLFQATLIKNAISVTHAGFLAFWGKQSEDRTVFSPNSSKVRVNIQLENDMKLAKMVQRGHSSSSLDGKMSVMDQYEAREMGFGLIEEEGSLNSTQLENALADEIPLVRWDGTVMSRQERMRALFMKLYRNKAMRVFRTNAFLASQAILTGKHDQILGTTNADFQYDFQRPGASIVDLTGTEWNTGTPDIMGDINAGCEYVHTTGQRVPEVLILGQGMLAALINDATMQKLADNRRYELLQVTRDFPVPTKFNRLIQAGMTAYGRMRTTEGHELWMFTFIGNYTDLAGSSQKFMPTDSALISSFEGVCDRYFGPEDKMPKTSLDAQWENEVLGFSSANPPMLEGFERKALDGAIFDPRSLYADVRSVDSGKAYVFRVQQSGIYAPTEVGCYYTMNDGLV